MNQNTRRPLPAGLGAILSAAILASIAGEDAQIPGMTKLELDGKGSLDEQLKRAIEAGAARHRETCAACREAHEGMQPKDPSIAEHDAVREKLKATQDQERMELAKQHEKARAEFRAIQTRQIDEMVKRHAEEREALDQGLTGKRGFMLFHGGEPLYQSFNTDRGVLEELLAKLVEPDTTGILAMLGIDTDDEYEIRAVVETETAFAAFD